MIILAIETSCDETAISVVKMTGGLKMPKFDVLAEVIASQVKVHAEFGGVVPNLAKREHEKNLPLLLERVMPQAGKIDAIAVTVGPGLEPALWVGINFARALSLAWNKPLIPTNHLAGHIYAALAQSPRRDLKNRTPRSRLKMQFPALALIVSGGHTELVLVKDWYKHKVIGRTRDDAAGEAFDKVARLLGLPFPGGPALAKLADEFKATPLKTPKVSPWQGEALSLPRPMINSGDFDFSFSGLKTAVLYKIKDKKINEVEKAALAKEFQNAVVDVLVEKTRRAILKHSPQTLVIGGGVSANKMLRAEMQKLAKQTGVTLLLPAFTHSIDNATMIGVAAAIQAKIKPSSLRKPGAKLTARGRLAL